MGFEVIVNHFYRVVKTSRFQFREIISNHKMILVPNMRNLVNQ